MSTASKLVFDSHPPPPPKVLTTDWPALGASTPPRARTPPRPPRLPTPSAPPPPSRRPTARRASTRRARTQRRARHSRKSYALTPIHESQGGPCMDDRRGQGKHRTLSGEYKERYSCTSTYNRDLDIGECIDRTILALDCLKARIENANMIVTKPGYWERYSRGWDSHQQPMRLLRDIIRKNHTHCVKRVKEEKLGARFNSILGEINQQQHDIYIPDQSLRQPTSEARGIIKTPTQKHKRTQKRKRTQKHKRTQKRKRTHSRKKRTKKRALKKRHPKHPKTAKR